MIKRILSFNTNDWRHIFYLAKDACTNFFKGDLSDAYEAWMWIRIHFTYDSKKIK